MERFGYQTQEQLNYDYFCDLIDAYNLSGEDVLRLLTAYHGLKLISDDFIENLTTVEEYVL